MKLYATDNSELMDIAAIRKEGSALIIDGTILGAMPIGAIIEISRRATRDEIGVTEKLRLRR